MSSENCLRSCNHHHNHEIDISITTKSAFVPPFFVSIFCPTPGSLKLPAFYHYSVAYSRILYKWNHTLYSFSLQLLSLGKSFEIHPAFLHVSVVHLFLLSSISSCGFTNLLNFVFKKGKMRDFLGNWDKRTKILKDPIWLF